MRRGDAEHATQDVHQGTLGNWVNEDRIECGEAEGLTHDERSELKRLRKEVAELRTERVVLKRSVVPWIKEAERHEALSDPA